MINYQSDCHIHTYFSPDADPKATFESYIKQAKSIGIQQLTFTDHVDFDAVHPLFSKMIDYDQYIRTFNQVKEHTNMNEIGR